MFLTVSYSYIGLYIVPDITAKISFSIGAEHVKVVTILLNVTCLECCIDQSVAKTARRVRFIERSVFSIGFYTGLSSCNMIHTLYSHIKVS